jgi:RNA-splicing ligase RtcB
VHAGYGFAIGNVAAFDMYVSLVLLPHGLSTNPPPPPHVQS